MQDLRIYKTSLDLTTQIYKLINRSNPLKKDFALNDQLRRASISVVANIAEGSYRTLKHNKNYLNISSGSANEVVALLQIVTSVYKISTTNLQEQY